MHCAGGGYEAHFGGGTRLTVLGKESTLSSFKYCITVVPDRHLMINALTAIKMT